MADIQNLTNIGTGNGNTKFNLALPEKKENSEESKKQSAFSFLKKLVGSADPEPKKGNGDGAKEGNAFTKLFGAKPTSEKVSNGASQGGVPVNGEPIPEPLGKLMREKHLLSKRPEISEMNEEKKLARAKKLFTVVFALAAIFISFVFLQRNANIGIFGDTIAKKFEESNASLIAIQTEANEARLRLALYHVNRANLLGDSFLFQRGIALSSQSTAAEKVQAETKLETPRQEIIKSLSAAADALAAPLAANLVPVSDTPQDMESEFENALVASLTAKRSEEDPRTVDTLMQFVQNRAFRNYLGSLSGVTLDDGKIEEAIKKIRSIGSDDLSLIAQLNENRVRWTEVMGRIDELTKRVDKVYGQGLFDELGGIRYTNYDFDTATGQVSLSGQVKTDDSKTFTLLANIIDVFEKSPYFKDVDMREFTKSQGDAFGFTSNLRLQFSLQGPEPDPRDETQPTL